MEILLNFVSRYAILIGILIFFIIYFALLVICIRHIIRNGSFTTKEKKKWIWHLIHWNVFAIPVYWKKYMLARKH